MKHLFSLIVLYLLFSCQPQNKQVLEAQFPDSETFNDSNKKSEESKIPGSEDNPIKFYFTPSVSAKVIKRSADDITSFLEKETGLKFKIIIPASYHQMIEDFGNDRADLAIMNSFSYLIAKNKYDVNAKLRSLRYGKSTYQGQIIANIKSNIQSINDLEGKKFAFTDSSSTSGYLFPNQIMRDNHISLASKEFLSQHDAVVRKVYLGEVDAGATFYSDPSESGEIRDARARIMREFPDVMEKVKIIELTKPIPNDPVVFHKSISNELSNKLVFAIMKYSFTDQGKAILSELYGTEGFVRCSDDDYRLMDEVIQESGIDISTYLQ